MGYTTRNNTAGFETAKALLHEIRVALLPNYLEGGKYAARTENERTINIDEIYQNMKERSRFEGDYDAAHDRVKRCVRFIYRTLNPCAI